VYVKYIDPNSNNWTQALSNLVAAIASNDPGTVWTGENYSSSTSSFPFGGLLNTSGSNGDGPKAYLNWLVFDQNFVLVNGGYIRMSDAAREYGQDCAHEMLSAEIPITNAGFVYVYLSNENESIVEVYYDEFTVSLTKSPVINSTDLYPYGAPALSYSRENSLKQDKLLNGKEWQNELDYNTFDLGQRDIDPFVPVFPTIDRFAEKYHWMSPYQYNAGNPVKYVDVNGDSLWIKSSDGNLLYQNGKMYSKSEDGKFSEYKGKLARLDKEGKVKGYKGILGTTVNALGKLSDGSEFANKIISTLQSSENNFTIKPNYNTWSFAPVDMGNGRDAVLNNNAYAFQVMDQGYNMVDYSPFNKIGSGGSVHWNPRDGIIGLIHELGHSYDANFGMLDDRKVTINGEKEVIREIRAVYYENRVRQELGKPLRKRYVDGPKLLDGNKSPMFYPTPFFMKMWFR
jgi:hypothetical protein